MRVRSMVGSALVAVLVFPVGIAPMASASPRGDGPSFVPEATAGRPVPEGTWLPWTPSPVGQEAGGEVESPWPEVGPIEGATAGRLDPSLASDGTLTPNLSAGPEDGASVAVQPDGKLVVGGSAGLGNSRLQVARFNADGTWDTTFGGGDGVVQKNLSPGPDWIEDLALQPDGKIVAVGSAWGVSFVIRFNADGTLDPAFGEGGRQLLAVGRGFNVATAVVVDPSDRIAFAGRGGGQGGRFVFARVNADGDPDLTFSDDGIAPVNLYAGDDMAWDLVLQPDGKLVASGSTELHRLAMAVVRVDDHGALDPTFDFDGFRTFGPRGIPALATAVALQDDGAILAGGLAVDHGGEMIVARVTPDGRLDTSFNGGRHAIVDFSGGQDMVWRLAVRDGGAIVAVGRAGGSGGRFAVAQLTPTGALDPAFSGDGKLTTDLTDGDDQAHSVAIDADGNLVASGYADGRSTASRLAVVRYLGS